ncbi:transcriptional regulator [Halolactibacillus alkaliphilus]|uniref:Transcriptional regulator n=1 Tax=Halolactibacillus alkaliphilus TaxID=442899 RepID=A0A511X0A1_9BACI|nr:ROK family protein [Halolactibacillus alkaliphilus]GEN56376.1 transcriptional regulator [Halolactibacillus alkaliphilus]GGN67452.1 transcriptional regulator [Halolactibacillus alkaliphilus]SFO92062.1 Sugar kinase of the NBD/HSP70 family, may contain an N-terminal HTH domain [Halolactibacillus alkaliphilus]
MGEFIAFDIGGTYIKYGLIDNQSHILEQNKVKTPNELEELLTILQNYANLHKRAKGVAISIPGAVSDDGFVYGKSAISYIHGPNMKQLIEQRTNLPVYIENDANCAGYAEMWGGSAKGKKDVIVMAIGTGIGGAIIKEGVIHKGANLHGGEFGFMLLSLDRDIEENTWVRMDSTVSMIKKVAKKKNVPYESLSGEDVFKLAENGDEICIKAVDLFYHKLAIGIFNLQYIYDPEVILLSGGISARADLIHCIYKKLDSVIQSMPNATVRPVIDFCKYRQNANLIGAVYGLKQQFYS